MFHSDAARARYTAAGSAALRREPLTSENGVRHLFTQPPSAGVRPAILLDRDGVINERIRGGYVAHWEQFRFVRGIRGALARLTALGVPLIVVSNQAGVGKGMVSPAALAEITERFVVQLAKGGARIAAVYYCPHTPDDGCSCRKPRPGLLERAAKEWSLDLKQSILIGDSPSDVEAAAAVNCRAILFSANAKFPAPTEHAQRAGLSVARRPSQIPPLVSQLLGKA